MTAQQIVDAAKNLKSTGGVQWEGVEELAGNAAELEPLWDEYVARPRRRH